VETKLVEGSRGVKLQVTLGRAFIMGFGFMWGVGVAAVLPGLIVLIVVAAAACSDESGPVVTATPTAAAMPATAAVPTVTAEEPTAAAAWEECDGDQDCLDRQCVGVLGAPEGARSGEISDCVYWLDDLPSADPRRDVDRERVKVELCKRNPDSDYVRRLLGYTGGSADCQ
jgi:hypothetical protein